jgi:hypothetical protein
VESDELLSQRLSAISERVGFALWQIQELESIAAHLYVLCGSAKPGMGLAAGEALLASAMEVTFGRTIARIRRAALVDESLQRRLDVFLNERNWLVHKSRLESRSAVHQVSEFTQLMARLREIDRVALALIRSLGSVIEGFAKSHGVTQAYVDAEAKRLLHAWRSGNAI